MLDRSDWCDSNRDNEPSTRDYFNEYLIDNGLLFLLLLTWPIMKVLVTVVADICIGAVDDYFCFAR